VRGNVLAPRDEDRDDELVLALERLEDTLGLGAAAEPADLWRELDTPELLLDFRKELLNELLDGLLNVIRELVFLVLLGRLLEDRFDVLLDGRL